MQFPCLRQTFFDDTTCSRQRRGRFAVSARISISCAASCLVRERYLKLIAFSPEEKNTFTFVVFSFYGVDNLTVGFTTPSFTARFSVRTATG